MFNKHIIFCVFLSFFLAGCVADRLAFWRAIGDEKEYVINGLENDEDTNMLLQQVLADRFSQEFEEEARSAIEIAVVRDLEKVLYSKGYYNANVTYEQAEVGEYIVDAGDITTISSIAVQPLQYQHLLKETGLKVGDPLDAAKVYEAQSRLFKTIQKGNCAFGLRVTHRVLLNTDLNKAELVFDVAAGRDAVFGPVTFAGHEGIKDVFIIEKLPWKEGECYQRSQIESFKDRVLGSGLFSGVEEQLPSKPNADGSVPIHFVLKQKPHRSIKAGVSYYTDEGPGIILGWEHRNFLGHGEVFKTDLDVNILEQTLNSSLMRQNFLRKEQTLTLTSRLGREDTDAYEKVGAKVGFRVARQWREYYSGRVGADFELSRIDDKDNEETEQFGILSPVAALTYDSRDDTLDPQRGFVLNSQVSPSVDILAESDPYFTTELSGQHYLKLHEKLTFASRLKVGSILGSDTDNLPATARLFAGGGGSVRGFGFQEVGPVNEDGDPQGGRSVIEGSGEFRFKFTSKLGGVTFVDFGQVDDSITPSVDDLSFGVGAGLRYFTGFGPLRFDLGVPLNNDENVDENFQVYFSIGQAF
ncbi:MAG: BamA/TamA family outer membrane protein [Alphaproteobacteria bacterium]|nr:BamA/TamA family outer membrane protein [Alphaproteobacteria bacterium]